MDRRSLIKSLGALVGIPFIVDGKEVAQVFKVEPKARYLFVVRADEDFTITARQLSQLGVEGAILPTYNDPKEALSIYRIDDQFEHELPQESGRYKFTDNSPKNITELVRE